MIDFGAGHDIGFYGAEATFCLVCGFLAAVLGNVLFGWYQRWRLKRERRLGNSYRSDLRMRDRR